MRLVKENFNSIKSIWDSVFQDMPTPCQYMQYDFQRIYKKYLKIGKQRAGMKYTVFVAYDKDKARCIIPLLLKPNKKDYYIAGDLCATGSLDLIYDSELTVNEMSEILSLLPSQGVEGVLHVHKMQSNSLVFQSIFAKNPNAIFREESCVRICFGSDYEDYISSLSKSVRQNLRTAHNRLKRENRTETYNFCFGSRALDEKEILRLYHKRANEKNNKKRNVLIEKVQDTFNPITRALRQVDNAFTSVFRIDGKIASVMQGFVSRDQHSVVIPHLAINSEYSIYSPGAVLISQTIEYFISNTSIRELDLSRGDETYKFAMGGTKYSIINTDYLLE